MGKFNNVEQYNTENECYLSSVNPMTSSKNDVLLDGYYVIVFDNMKSQYSTVWIEVMKEK